VALLAFFPFVVHLAGLLGLPWLLFIELISLLFWRVLHGLWLVLAFSLVDIIGGIRSFRFWVLAEGRLGHGIASLYLHFANSISSVSRGLSLHRRADL